MEEVSDKFRERDAEQEEIRRPKELKRREGDYDTESEEPKRFMQREGKGQSQGVDSHPHVRYHSLTKQLTRCGHLPRQSPTDYIAHRCEPTRSVYHLQ